MSEYNIQMNKYNALSDDYDQLYPQPMKHANTHAKDGNDPITPSMIGTYNKTEIDTALQKKENSFSVLPLNKGGIGCSDIFTFRGNFGINKQVACSAGGSITITLPKNSLCLICANDNMRLGAILVQTGSQTNNVRQVSPMISPSGWSYSLSGGTLTLSETTRQYDVGFGVCTLDAVPFGGVYV